MARAKMLQGAKPVSNKILAIDVPVHDWYRFVLSFPPHLVRHYLTQFKVDRYKQVLDPFCGTGTTLVESKKLGIPSIGVEANPMAHFACETKGSIQVEKGISRGEMTMSELTTRRRPKGSLVLKCFRCGNADRFIEIM